MGALADTQAQALTFGPSSPLGIWIKQELKKRADAGIDAIAAAIDSVHTLATDATDTTGGDFTLTVTLRDGSTFTTAAMAFGIIGGGAANAIHVIATDATDHTGGNFTLTVTLNNGETFTTNAIAYNTNALNIEVELDTAATGVITGWTNGDISVSASAITLQDGTLTLTFDGTSVSGEPSHILTTMVDSRTGGVSPSPTLSNTTVGVESSINLAAIAASIVGFAEGDIQVSGGTLQAGTIVLTFSGSVSGGINHPVTVFNDSRTGGAAASPLVVLTTPGQTVRAAWSVLVNLGVITASLPTQTADADETVVTKGANTVSIPDVIIKAIMREAAAEDANNNSYFSLQAALMPQDRAPLVEPIGTESVLPS